MSVRSIIVLLALPLFLLLAAVNSMLLYREETRDMDRGLRGQALAAAVTVAEFAKASADPVGDLSQPHRLRALRAGTKDILGLDALYVVQPGKPPLNLIARPLIAPRTGPAPARPEMVDSWQDGNGRPLISAIAPAGGGTMVVADVDAEPLVRRHFHLKRLSIVLILGSSALAILLGLIIARRVIGEFRRTRAIIEAHGVSSGEADLGIREVRDLADAIHLIDASVASELQRLGGGGDGNSSAGIAAERARHFPDVSEIQSGVRLSIRALPGAPAGAFHFHQPRDGGYVVALGEITGEPARALAAAIALRNHVLAGPPGQFEARLASAGAAFGVEREKIAFLTGDGEPTTLTLNGNEAAIAGYAARNAVLDPDMLTTDLAILFPDAGVVASARPA